MVRSAVIIQRAFRKHKEKKVARAEEAEMPDLCDPETLAAALKIQSAFKGYQVRKVEKKVPLTPQPSIDFENMTPADLNSSKVKSKRVPPVPQRSDTKEMQRNTSSYSSSSSSKTVPKHFGVKDSPKSPLPARSSKLKEVPIPSVPPKTKQRMPSSSSSNVSETDKEAERGKQCKEADDAARGQSRSPEKDIAEGASHKDKEDATKSKIGGFFSSMFKSKSKQKVTAPAEMKSPEASEVSEGSVLAEVKFKFDETGKFSQEDLKSATKVKTEIKMEPDTDNRDRLTEDEQNEKISQSSLNSNLEDPNLKKDLIHTVLSAVQENWLNQAPKPTLDKVAALQRPDSDPELENSERSTSEADYKKKKTAAQQGEGTHSDDEGAQLWKQESADGDLPYVETTLPQERPGVVSITPSSMRISQVQLAGTERPRITCQRKPGTLSEFVKTKDGKSAKKDPLTVKLPRQDSKTKLKSKAQPNQQSWDNFSAAGLQTQKQAGRREPPKSMPLPKSGGQAKDWVDCESLPEKKKQPKKFGVGVTEPVKSPSEGGRPGLQTPAGRQIVSPEECSCDCHHSSPPHTLARQRLPPVPAPSSASTRKVTPTAPKKTDLASKGAVPKSSGKRVGGPPTPPIRTTSVQKHTKTR